MPLKNYSGPALEGWTEFIVELICTTLQKQYPHARIEFDKAYIKSDFPDCSDERLDMHVKVNGLYVYLQEDRAWLDKPFYSLKRAVFKSISVSCKSQLHPNCQYAAVGYWFETGFDHNVVKRLVKTIYEVIENAAIEG